MGGFLAYTVETGVIFALLIAIYKRVYYGISYNKWERSYLLAAPAVSCLLPFLKKEYEMAPVPKPADSVIEIVERCDEYDIVTLSRQRGTDVFWSSLTQNSFFEKLIAIIFAIYLLGVIVKLVSFVRGIAKTLRLMRKSEKKGTISDVDIFNADVNTVAFSFFGNIFLGNKSRGLSEAEMDVIIKHELQHASDRHSIDTLVYGLFSAFQWFNPIARLAARYSRIVCENIADSQAAGDDSLTEYSKLVLRLGIKNRDENAVKKSRRKSPLVDRIAQLLNTDSQNIRRIRFFAALPVLIIAIVAYIVFWGMITPTDPRHEMPVKGEYEITAGYFNYQKICDSDGKISYVAHKCVNIQLAQDAFFAPPAESENLETNGDATSFRLGKYAVTIKFPTQDEKQKIPASLIVADQNGKMIDPQIVFKL